MVKWDKFYLYSILLVTVTAEDIFNANSLFTNYSL